MNVGDKVTWVSQAGGRSKTKSGEIIAVVPSGTRPYSLENATALFEGRGSMVDIRSTSRSEASYLVLVDNKVYWPRVALLERVK